MRPLGSKKVHWFDGKFTRETDVASPLYFAPEVAKKDGQKIKPYKADIWSMGMVAVAVTRRWKLLFE